jgi:hypothetical protein
MLQNARIVCLVVTSLVDVGNLALPSCSTCGHLLCQEDLPLDVNGVIHQPAGRVNALESPLSARGTVPTYAGTRWYSFVERELQTFLLESIQDSSPLLTNCVWFAHRHEVSCCCVHTHSLNSVFYLGAGYLHTAHEDYIKCHLLFSWLNSHSWSTFSFYPPFK